MRAKRVVDLGLILFVFVLLALASLLLALPTAAQGPTDAPVAAATAEPAPVLVPVVLQAQNAPPLAGTGEIVMSIAGLIGVVMAAVIAGGATVGGFMLLVIRYINTNPTLKRALELMFLSQPVDRQHLIREVVEAVKEGVELVDDVTDGELPPVRQSARPGAPAS